MPSFTFMRRRLLQHAALTSILGALQSAHAASGRPKPAARSGTLLVVGDSLSAEYGLQRGEGWVALMAERLKTQAPEVEVVNASISGDTTAGGRSRLSALIQKHQPRWVILELGGNDALRGLPLSNTRDNLVAMARMAQAAQAQVLLIGMQVPPNYGQRYAKDFAQVFSEVAQTERCALVPFLLSGVADGPNPTELFQADRIHPTAKAQGRMMENVWRVLKPMLA